MFEREGTGGVDDVATGLPESAEVARWAEALAASSRGLDDDARRIDLITQLERLANTVRGAQAALTNDLDRSQRARQAERGVPTARRGRGVASQVALARHESPHLGQRHLELATVLHREMPHTLRALRTGHISEWRAMILVRETACLSREHRAVIDARLAADPVLLGRYGDRALIAEVVKLSCELDPEALVARRRTAEKSRHVRLRPAPDGMAHFSAMLPVADGVGLLATLEHLAEAAVATGDPRTRGQLMADTLVERVTGRRASLAPATESEPDESGPGPATDASGTAFGRAARAITWDDCDTARTDRASADNGGDLPIMVNLIMSPEQLLGAADGAAYVEGYGFVDADLARSLAKRDQVWLRRLFTEPDSDALATQESRARLFPEALKRLIRFRDRTCRTPWCDAPIRHIDHAVDHADGGPTSFENGQGLCAACNHAKQAPDWRARPTRGPDGRHQVTTNTPTGHSHTSRAPDILPTPLEELVGTLRPEPPYPPDGPRVEIVWAA
ncbi:DUF222 domain-containing protein [Microlunatus sp. Y2014]|uniref:HNH endonuclease n=1 Tax=Microlunatus sp. Y2014 TaxID=3418488 RepID=UPI003DA757FD